ncbi:MAG: threonine synthase [Chloroflexi bacterium]|nr:threonine synthase [Chloroflexota bacterium]
MTSFRLRCIECAALHDAGVRTLACRRCGSPLEVLYEGDGPSYDADFSGIWGLGALLPIGDRSCIVSLGEGNTPVVRLEGVGRGLGLVSLWGKLEYQAPTGSFKDRGTTVLMSALKEAGVREIVEDSSGNAGASLAAYAARAGVVAHIFAPSSAPVAKLQQIQVYGAKVHTVDGSREAATEAAKEFAEERGLVYASHNLSSYVAEGTKTFAYEIAQQMAGRMPRHVVIPVGNGSLLIGAWKGFLELRAKGVIAEMPHLYGVQAEVVQPIAAAYEGREWRPQEGSRTIAGGISVGQPPRLRQALRAMQETGGRPVAVTDEAILRWQLALARQEGIYAEPTSAAAFAGLEALVSLGFIAAGDTVLAPVTGIGLKDAPPV